MRCRLFAVFVLILSWSSARSASAEFDLVITIASPSSFSAPQLAILEDAIDDAERMWERVITGYQPGITITQIPISIFATSGGLANANPGGNVNQGGFNLASSGTIRINSGTLDLCDVTYNAIEDFANFEVDADQAAFPGERANVIDELIAHEIGHVLGIGTKWTTNGLYINGTGQYTGKYGLAAYREDFDPNATFVPVEIGSAGGTNNAHWDQLMRSAGEAGVADCALDLDPALGITDQAGRDLSLELMTGAIDPDRGEPFLSRMTIQSLRDLGFTVVPEPTTAILLVVAGFALGYRRRLIG